MIGRILLVEDEPGLVTTLSDRLKSESYDVDSALDGEVAMTMARNSSYDIMILDVMLPKKNGFDVLRDLRQEGIGMPVIMLTAKGQTIDKVVGLKLGADDYLTKPFEMAELLARIEAIQRRYARPAGRESVHIGESVIDFRKGVIRRGHAEVPLTAQELRLLKYLVEHRGAVLSREELLQNVWHHAEQVTTRTVDVHIAWLRQKIEPDPRHPAIIFTVHKVGYKFAP